MAVEPGHLLARRVEQVDAGRFALGTDGDDAFVGCDSDEVGSKDSWTSGCSWVLLISSSAFRGLCEVITTVLPAALICLGAFSNVILVP